MDALTKRSSQRGPLVVKVGGALLDEAGAHRATFEGLAALHRARTAADSDGVAGGVVLVHGGGLAVDRQLARLGITTERIEGIRVTPPQVVEEIAGVLAGQMNTRLIGLLSAAGARPVGLTLGDGGLCLCRKSTRYPFDPGAVGEIIGGDPSILHTVLAGGFLPVVSSIGLDGEGGMLNVNADDAAAALAGIVAAESLVLLTDVPGVLGRDGRVIPTLDRPAIDALIADGVITGGMIAKVRGALAAADESGVPVTIASWKEPQSIGGSPAGAERSTRIQPTPASPRLEVIATGVAPTSTPRSQPSLASNTR